MHDLKLKSLFKEALEAYDYYGNTFVDKDSWKVIVSLAKEKGGEALAVVEELASWVEANFEENEEFTIIGM